MTGNYKGIENTVSLFVASLDTSEREVVRGLILGPQIRPSHIWYDRVVATYLSGEAALPLIEEILEKYANEAFFRELDTPVKSYLFEARMILREVQAVLNSSAHR